MEVEPVAIVARIVATFRPGICSQWRRLPVTTGLDGACGDRQVFKGDGHALSRRAAFDAPSELTGRLAE
jgi:hypothetical protein